MKAVSPELATYFTKQDSIILNLLRAYEASIDVAMIGAGQPSGHSPG